MCTIRHNYRIQHVWLDLQVVTHVICYIQSVFIRNAHVFPEYFCNFSITNNCVWCIGIAVCVTVLILPSWACVVELV